MATTTNFGWETPDDTDLVKDGAAAMRTLGNSIDTSFVDLKGGTTGQVLAKASNTDLDYSWVAQDDSNAIQNAIVDAKGDLIAATAADTPARLAVGTNGQVLTADSTAATGIKWATPASGGKVLQVVFGSYATQATSATNALADTGLTATITPTSSTSKILVIVSQQGVYKGDLTTVVLNLLRGSTTILKMGQITGYTNTTAFNAVGTVTSSYLDSPATTSATTYKTQFANYASYGTVYVQGYIADAASAVSTITLMEIGA